MGKYVPAVAGLLLVLTVVQGAANGVLAHARQTVAIPAEAVRIDSGRFTFVAFPKDERLARSLLSHVLANDTFPGLPRPTTPVRIEIAPDGRRFREWAGPGAPEWGAAIAIPEEHRIVLQGTAANSSAGDPRETVRHELAHLALHEWLGNLPPRWFDEGYASYAAGEWGRDELLATNAALVIRGMPHFDNLDAYFRGGESRAQQGYALAQTAVAEIAGLDPARGLSLFFSHWRDTQSFDVALRRAYGITEPEMEARWRSNVRLRYGGLALFADITVGALALLLLLGPAWIGRRRRDRRRLAQMRVADAAQEARERESALRALLSGVILEPPPKSDENESRGNGSDDNLIN
jgi:hypothetical protein